MVSGMNSSARGWLCLLVGAPLVCGACKESGPGTTEGATGTTGGSSGGVTGGPSPLVGVGCDHGGDLGFETFHFSRDEDACGDGICAYVDLAVPPMLACVGDEDCNVADPSRGKFACVDGGCRLSEAYRRERSMCAFACESDADCSPSDPETFCMNGFKCVVASSDCCQPLCLCVDDLSQAQVEEATAACADDPAPDCPVQ